MIDSKDVTILVQGPADSLGMRWAWHIDEYKSVADKIIFSTWEDTLLDTQREFLLSHGVEVVETPLTEKGYIFDDVILIHSETTQEENPTLAWALRSTYEGLAKCNTKYVIKLRSDEYYYNLHRMLNALNEDTNKVVCGNIFVRSSLDIIREGLKCKPAALHMGDHLFCGETTRIINAYKYIINQSISRSVSEAMIKTCAEQLLCIGILCSNGLADEKFITDNLHVREKVLDFFVDNFHIFDVNDLEKFCCRWGKQHKTWVDKFVNHHEVYTMDDYINKKPKSAKPVMKAAIGTGNATINTGGAIPVKLYKRRK